MGKAVGMAEFNTVSSGVDAADAMVKTSEVDIIEAQTVCPGKYIVIISGDLSAVRAAIDSAKSKHSERCIDSVVLGNPHPSIFPALYGATGVKAVNSLGVLETFDASAILLAADDASKTADVELIEIRMARGMCGKSYLFLTGEVAAVQAAIERAKSSASRNGMFLDSIVIARPDEKIINSIL